jgi:hypothetical protein
MSHVAASSRSCNNFFAVSTPNTGKRSSVNSPICFDAEALAL